jgi:hypothetical protein
VLTETESETEVEEEAMMASSEAKDFAQKSQDLDDPEAEPAEITALKLELSTLSTSYASLQSTLVLLQSQLIDLKRVNNHLQEENESYMILLREKTLSGQFDVMRTVGTESSSDGDEADEDEDEDRTMSSTDHSSLHSTGRQPLEPVEEHEYEHEYERDLAQELERAEAEVDEDSPSKKSSRHRKKGSMSTPSGQQGESLAGLGVTGPGLDLAAELGRAENKDILEGNGGPVADNASPRKKGRKSGIRSVSLSSAGVLEPKSAANDIDALRNEVKSLKDANKALSLYASRIIDRIIAQEGFEHVLAVDYTEKTPTSPAAGASAFSNTAAPKSPTVPDKKPRPQTTFFGRQVSNPSQQPFPGSEQGSAANQIPPEKSTASARQNRRSLSFDWRSFSVFGGGERRADGSNLRPLTLGSGQAVAGARKLDTQEDEEDRRERERLNATMKLMGIEKPPNSPPIMKSVSSPMDTIRPAADNGRPPLQTNNSSPSPAASRWSFFRSRSQTYSESSSLNSAPSGTASPRPGNLTQEALEQAEAQEKLAALDAHEKALSAELAKGGSGGFTEIAPRRSRGGRQSAGGSGSGSTVWSAGMSTRDGHHDED